MKKLFVAAVLLGFLNFAQATTYTTTSLESIDGNNFYTWGINGSALAGQTVTAATLTFNNLTLTVAGPNDNGGGIFWTHLLDLSSSSVGVNTAGSDNDNISDAFSGQGAFVGKATFAKVGSTYSTLTYDLGALGDLTTLTSYLANGYFGFGFDPDCHFTDNGITLTITTTTTTNHSSVPDAASTAMLLGAGLSCLGILRRKLS